MIHKFKFWVENIAEGTIESEIMKYNLKDYDSYEDMIFQMEQDRMDWTFEQIHSGYTEIKKK